MAKQSKIDFRIFRRLLKFARPYSGLLILAFIGVVLLSVLGPLRPMIIGDMVQKYVIESKNSQLFLKWTLIVAGILLLEALLQFLSTYFSNLMAQSVIRDIRIKVFNHLSTFRMQFFDRSPVGGLVTRVVSDIEAISEVFSSGLIDILGDLLMLVVVLSLMFFTDWELSLLALIPIPILIFATRVFAKAMRKSFQQEGTAVHRLNSFVQERLT